MREREGRGRFVPGLRSAVSRRCCGAACGQHQRTGPSARAHGSPCLDRITMIRLPPVPEYAWALMGGGHVLRQLARGASGPCGGDDRLPGACGLAAGDGQALGIQMERVRPGGHGRPRFDAGQHPSDGGSRAGGGRGRNGAADHAAVRDQLDLGARRMGSPGGQERFRGSQGTQADLPLHPSGLVFEGYSAPPPETCDSDDPPPRPVHILHRAGDARAGQYRRRARRLHRDPRHRWQGRVQSAGPT